MSGAHGEEYDLLQFAAYCIYAQLCRGKYEIDSNCVSWSELSLYMFIGKTAPAVILGPEPRPAHSH